MSGHLPGYDPSWDTLTEAEWAAYADLVDAFTAAKRAKRYAESDALRKRLKTWQEFTGDERFMMMSEAGHYQWWPIFEERNHRAARIAARKQEAAA